MLQRVRKFIKHALASVLLLAALAWTADWLILRHKISQAAGAYGEYEVHYRFAVHLKNRRIEQRFEKATIECVHSLFPHYDEAPCWYLSRHTEQLQELNGAPWHFFYDDE